MNELIEMLACRSCKHLYVAPGVSECDCQVGVKPDYTPYVALRKADYEALKGRTPADPQLSLNDELKQLLDRRVTLYVGAHSFQGQIGETDCDDVVVLHTSDRRITYIRIEAINAYTLHLEGS